MKKANLILAAALAAAGVTGGTAALLAPATAVAHHAANHGLQPGQHASIDCEHPAPPLRSVSHGTRTVKTA